MDGSVAVAIAVPIGAIVVWALRLEGRLNVQERLNAALREDLTYIRDRIDRALNGRHE